MTRPGSITYSAIDNWDRAELHRKAATGEPVERSHRRWFVAEIESQILFDTRTKAVLVPDHSDPRWYTS